MKLYAYLIIVTILLIGAKPLLGQQPGFAWLNQAADGEQDCGVIGIAADPSGNVFSACSISGLLVEDDTIMDTNGATQKIIKQDSNGNRLWMLTIGGSNGNIGICDIATDNSGNCYFIARYRGTPTVGGVVLTHQGEWDIFVAKITPLGEYLWVKQAGGTPLDYNVHVAVTPTGECFISGRCLSVAYIAGQVFDPGNGEILITAKLTYGGEWDWVRQAVGQDSCTISEMVVDIIGNCYLIGRSIQELDFDVDQAGFSVSGVFCAKYDISGNCLMICPLSTDNDVYPYAMVADQQGGVYIYLRAVSGSHWVYNVWHVTANANVSNICSITSSGLLYPRHILRESSGNLYVTGEYTGQIRCGNLSVSTEEGIFFLKLTSSGEPLSLINLLTIEPGDFSFKMALNSDGTMYFESAIYREVTIGGIESISGRHHDAINLFKLTSTGAGIWRTTTWLDTQTSTGVDICKTLSESVSVCGNYTGETFMGTDVLRNSGVSGSDIYVTDMSLSGAWNWARKAGGSGIDEVTSMVADAEGNRYLTGFFSQSASFGSIELTGYGNEDVFVAKIDAFGNWIWARAAGGSGFDTGSSITLDSEGYLWITGSFSESAVFGISTLQSQGGTDIFVAKLNTNGVFICMSRAGGSQNDQGRSLCASDDGIVSVTGAYSGNASFDDLEVISTGGTDVFIATLDRWLHWLWVRSAGGEYDDTGVGVGKDASGNSYITGTFLGTASFGEQNLTSLRRSEVFIAKLSIMGHWLWVEQAGGYTDDVVHSIEVDALGNSYIAGTTNGGMHLGVNIYQGIGMHDAFVIKLDPSGVWQWFKHAGSSFNEYGTGLELDLNGTLYLTGSFDGEIDLGNYNWIWPDGESETFIGCLMSGLPNEDNVVPVQESSISSTYPNPFSNSVMFVYQCETREKVKLSIYNLRGQLVRSLTDSVQEKGQHQVSWDGLDDRQQRCVNGVYIIRLQGDEKVSYRKVVLHRE